MRTIAALAVLGTLLLLLGPVAFGSGRALFVDQSRHVPAICLDSSPVMIGEADEIRRTPDNIECRPSNITFGRSFEE